MGGEPWFYFVPYQADVNSALQALASASSGRADTTP